MKTKTTKKAINNSFTTVLNIGYCEAHYLLFYKTPFAYSSGVNGWSCDYYDLGAGVCVSTGYKPIGHEVSHEVLKKYEQIAEGITHSDNDWAWKETQVNNLLDKLIEEVTK